MKIDSVVSDAKDSQQESNAAVEEQRSFQAAEGRAAESGASSHDLRASLAIVNGYSAALDASFEDLCNQYREILESDGDAGLSESADRLMALDADCRFCLSRLHTSIDQLKLRLQHEYNFVGNDRQEDAA